MGKKPIKRHSSRSWKNLPDWLLDDDTLFYQGFYGRRGKPKVGWSGNDQQMLLKKFWKFMRTLGKWEEDKNGRPHSRVRCYHPERNKNEVIQLLKHYSNIEIKYKYARENTKSQRVKFNKNKKYKRLWGRACIVCGCPASHRHHIIQLQNGGRNHKLNIVAICPSCHKKIHDWL